jgi:hypothetical protein
MKPPVRSQRAPDIAPRRCDRRSRRGCRLVKNAQSLGSCPRLGSAHGPRSRSAASSRRARTRGFPHAPPTVLPQTAANCGQPRRMADYSRSGKSWSKALFNGIFAACPRQDSNLRTRLRSSECASRDADYSDGEEYARLRHDPQLDGSISDWRAVSPGHRQRRRASSRNRQGWTMAVAVRVGACGPTRSVAAHGGGSPGGRSQTRWPRQIDLTMGSRTYAAGGGEDSIEIDGDEAFVSAHLVAKRARSSSLKLSRA